MKNYIFKDDFCKIGLRLSNLGVLQLGNKMGGGAILSDKKVKTRLKLVVVVPQPVLKNRILERDFSGRAVKDILFNQSLQGA